MEYDERQHLLIHLPELLETTVCNIELLAYLQASLILSRQEVEEIESKTTPTAKAYELYKIIQTRKGAYSHLLNALQLTVQTGAIAILKNTQQKQSLSKRSVSDTEKPEDESKRAKQSRTGILFGLTSSPTALFTGRRDELRELNNSIQSRSKPLEIRVTTQLTSISGLGGIGKTELARQYVFEHKEQFDNILWMNAETESTLHECFINLAKDILRIKTTDANGGQKDISTVVTEVYRELEGGKVLLIFDNAEREPYIRKFLAPPTREQSMEKEVPHVLLTSREREWECGIHVINLNEMKVEEAVEFVRKGLSIMGTSGREDELIISLVNKLQCFPLALQQAISYIREQQLMEEEYTVQNYLDEFETNKKELLDSSEFQEGLQNDYKHTTFTTWKITIGKISAIQGSGEVALKILNCMAFISPVNIERSMFLPILDQESHEKVLKSAVRLLVKHSMVNGQDKQNVLSIHRLVQEVIRLELERNGKTEECLHDVMKILQPLKSDGSLQYLSHMSSAWAYCIRYEKLVEEFSFVPFQIVKSLRQEILYDQAFTFGSGSGGCETLAKVLVPEHKHILKLEYEMCCVIYSQCKYGEALEKSKQLLERQRKSLPETSEDILETEHLLGRILRSLGKLDEVLQLSLELIEKKRQVYGANHENTLKIIHNTALCYFDMGKYDKAMEYCEIALEGHKASSGEWSRGVFITCVNIAVFKSCTGRLKESVTMLQHLYETRNQYKIDRRWILILQNNLAYDLLYLGELDKALELLKDTLKARTELYGETHTETLNTLRGIGIVMRLQGNYMEAVISHQKVYTCFKERFGDDHTKTLVAKGDLDLAWCYHGYHTVAMPSLQGIIKSLEQKLGSGNFQVLKLQLDYGEALEKIGMLDEALTLLDNVRIKIIANFTDAHYDLEKIGEITARIKSRETVNE